MPIISFDRKIAITPEQYQKILNTTIPKDMQIALDEYRKDPCEEIIDSQEIRKILGKWARED